MILLSFYFSTSLMQICFVKFFIKLCWRLEFASIPVHEKGGLEDGIREYVTIS